MPTVTYHLEPDPAAEEFIDVTAGLHTTLVLLAAPKAQSYYPHAGMTKHESCWVIARQPRQERERVRRKVRLP
ncbi:MAG TPA: hypothetical protein VH682_22865 [Gemmataceae bacterium]